MELLYSFLDNIIVLEILRILIFVGGFALANSYAIPKGICMFIEWKKTKSFAQLATAINLFSGGILLLTFLVARFIFKG